MEKKKWLFKFGIILISVSVLFFLFLFALPFVTLDIKLKIVLSTALLVVGEVSFWLGTILIGKDVYLKFREKLRLGEWFGKKKGDGSNKG
jgi:hypothetical protein